MPNAGNNLSSINIDNHTGTHIDAPSHFIENGKTIDEAEVVSWLKSWGSDDESAAPMK